jgi:hypothetical protein
MITIGISAFVSIIGKLVHTDTQTDWLTDLLGLGIGILFHRMVLKGHRLFDWGSNKGCLRPMPLDCMLFFLTFFNIRKITNEKSLFLMMILMENNLFFHSPPFDKRSIGYRHRA